MGIAQGHSIGGSWDEGQGTLQVSGLVPGIICRRLCQSREGTHPWSCLLVCSRAGWEPRNGACCVCATPKGTRTSSTQVLYPSSTHTLERRKKEPHHLPQHGTPVWEAGKAPHVCPLPQPQRRGVPQPGQGSNAPNGCGLRCPVATAMGTALTLSTSPAPPSSSRLRLLGKKPARGLQAGGLARRAAQRRGAGTPPPPSSRPPARGPEGSPGPTAALPPGTGD
jgi:hypothetical protein